MLRRFASLALLSTLLFAGNVYAANTYFKSIQPEFHQIVATDLYQGDQEGDFVGDIVAVLEDSSCWKIHPTRTDKFLAWNLDDVIHVGIRTNTYWFKREHKFHLVNHTKNEKIKVMLVNMPKEAPHIVTCETYVESSYLTTRTYWDLNGNSHTTLERVYVYAKRLILTDGTMWRINTNFHGFLVGDAVYISVQKNPKKGSYFLISGTQKFAECALAERIL